MKKAILNFTSMLTVFSAITLLYRGSDFFLIRGEEFFRWLATFVILSIFISVPHKRKKD